VGGGDLEVHRTIGRTSEVQVRPLPNWSRRGGPLYTTAERVVAYKAVMIRTLRAAAVLIAAAACGCDSSTPSPNTPPEIDAAGDAVSTPLADQTAPAPAEAGADATVASEAGPDAASHAETEASAEAGPDVGFDAETEASAEAALDAGFDAPVEASIEASVDASIDAEPDAPFCANGCQAVSVSIYGDRAGQVGNTPCALLTTGQVACWGAPMDGIAGLYAMPLPQTFDAPVVAEAVGYYALCAVLQGGTVQCQGESYYGELGSGATPGGPVVGIQTASAIAVGNEFACVLLGPTGTVACWGSNDFGQLGAATGGSSATPVTIPGISGATAIAAGVDHACVLLGDGGTVSCWGGGGGDQLLNFTNVNPAPVSIPGVAGATSIAASQDATCVIVGDGGVVCWGDNESNDLGTPSPGPFGGPVLVPGLAGPATAIAVGAEHACAVLATGGGTVACWGADTSGELGNGYADASAPASTVPGLSGVVQVAIGSSNTCAVLADGGVACWGSNEYEQLGEAADGGAMSLTPVPFVW
jgi:alpha-tubulin suppressor-like RCC1 family protein